MVGFMRTTHTDGCAECANPDLGKSDHWCRPCEIGIQAEAAAG